MRHLDTLDWSVRALSVLCVLLLGLLGAVAAPAAAGSIRLDAAGSGIAIGVPTADPTVYTVSLIASGQSATLGDFRTTAHHLTDVNTGTFFDGTITLEGVSGTLFGTYEGSEAGTGSPDIFTVTGTIKFTGGTGRFAGATGKATFEGTLQIISISPTGLVRETVTLELHGRLGL